MLKPNVILVAHTEDPQRLIAASARLMYSPSSAEDIREDMSEAQAEEFVARLAEMGHESPLEHASFTFAIEGVSRSFLAQITRHRIASYSVQSQRYVKKSDFAYIMPPAIAESSEASAIFQKAMEDDAARYEELAAILQKDAEQKRLAAGEDPKSARRNAEKQAIEDARFVLPNACDTKMLVTMNARSLLNFFHQRCCNRAQWEIRAVALKMLALVYPLAPGVFAAAGPGCVRGVCPEGKMSCGKPKETAAAIARLKEESLSQGEN